MVVEGGLVLTEADDKLCSFCLVEGRRGVVRGEKAVLVAKGGVWLKTCGLLVMKESFELFQGGVGERRDAWLKARGLLVRKDSEEWFRKRKMYGERSEVFV